MDAKVVNNAPFKDIADVLTAKGTAVPRYDKRTFVLWESNEELCKYYRVNEVTIEDAIHAVIDEGKMLFGFYDWFKWAPSKNQLAFISGEGRFFVENKNTTVADIPMKDKLRNFTPSGFVDLDIEWLSEDEVIVARAKENKEWNEGPMPTMYTALYIINIKTGEQKQLTFPKANEIDNSTQVIGSTITWTRKNEKQDQLDVWIKSNPTSPEQLWLEDVDMAPVFWGGISG
ncbi:hypothetical protein UACE39S_06379 [Ureibacillus acetophenoni]